MGLLSLVEWDLLIRQARRAQLLGRLATLAAETDVSAGPPAAPNRHIESAKRVVIWTAQETFEFTSDPKIQRRNFEGTSLTETTCAKQPSNLLSR